VRRLGDERRLMFCEKITEQKDGMHWSIVIMEQPFPPLTHTHTHTHTHPNQSFFSSLPLAVFSSP
jgi:hypothetical protein